MANNFFLKLSRFFLYLAPFSVIIVSRSTLFPFIVGKYVFFRIIVELALISFIWAWAFQSKEVRPLRGSTSKKLRLIREEVEPRKVKIPQILKSPLVIAVFVFTAIFLLAGFFGYDPSASFWSNFERGEGGLQMIHLFVFFILLVLLFRDEKSWRKMLKVFLLAAVLAITYGLLASLQYTDVEYNEAGGIVGGGWWYKTLSLFVGPSLKDAHNRFSGSFGNPAYLGTFMIFALFFTAILLLGKRVDSDMQRKPALNIDKFASYKKGLLAGLSILFFIALFLSRTRGAFLGLGVGIVVGLIYFFFSLPKGRLKNIILITFIILIVLAGLGFVYNSRGGGYRIFDINLNNQTFQTRLLLWKQALKITAERPLLGWGPENFSIALEKHYLPQFDVWFDRAHNVFFDYLAETGILGLLSYLGIFAAFYWRFFKGVIANTPARPPAGEFKNKYTNKISDALIFALPIAHLVQGIVLFEVLPIYIGLFLFLAFANYKFNQQEPEKRN